MSVQVRPKIAQGEDETHILDAGPNAQSSGPSLSDHHGYSRRQSVSNQSQFSLAGPNPWRKGNRYVSPEYQNFNPQYGEKSNEDEPVWSLAQPLPHIVRPSMRRGVLPEDRKEDKKHPQAGESKEKTEEEAVDAQQGPTEIGGEPRTAAADHRGFFNSWCKIRYYLREPLAEWLGVRFLLAVALSKR